MCRAGPQIGNKAESMFAQPQGQRDVKPSHSIWSAATRRRVSYSFRAALDSSRNDNASDKDVIRVRDFLAAALHVFQAKIDSLPDVGESFRNRFALRIAAWKGGTDHHVTTIVVVRLKKNLE